MKQIKCFIVTALLQLVYIILSFGRKKDFSDMEEVDFSFIEEFLEDEE